MGKTNWTADQKKAIDTEGKGVVVSAAAGSGKTAVLIERIISRLTKKGGVPADKLLAVTFTNAAAAQLRDKLNSAFEKRIKENPNDEWLLRQQNLLQLSKISTIDSFCLELVKENLHKFEFQGGLKILEETDKNLIFERSFEQAVNEMCADSPEKYEMLYNAFGAGRTLTDGEIYKHSLQLYEFLRSLAFREEWTENAAERYSEENCKKYMDNCYEQTAQMLDEAEEKIEKLRFYANYEIAAGEISFSSADHIGGLLDTVTKGKTKAGAISGSLNMIGEIKKYCREKKWDKLCEMHGGKTSLPSITVKGKKDLPEDILQIFEDVKTASSQIKKDISDMIKKALENFPVTERNAKKALADAGEIFKYLLELTERTEQIAYEYKLEKNSVDFSDIMLMAKELLAEKINGECRRTELAQNIRRSGMYQIIMIDEFQDVNNLQELIFRAISDSEDLNILGKNVFVVGDMKQAIYGFRLTNPELFKKNLELADDPKNSQFLSAVFLQKNFRSRKEVIEFTNFIFKQLMSEECGDVDYTQRERLQLGAEYSLRESPAEVILVDQSDDFDKSVGYSEENMAVAERIKAMLDEGCPVYSNGEERPCKPSDFCVLVMKNDERKGIAKALCAVGLKAKSEDAKGYLRSREITIALNFLRVIDNPMNDIALTAIMMSPALGFTADEMAQLSLLCTNPKNGFRKHIYQILVGTDSDKISDDEKSADYIDLKNEGLQKKCENTYRLINELRYCAMCMTVEELIRTVFDRTDLMGITSMYRDSMKKRANLRLLLEYASSYANSSSDGISGFLRYVDSVSSNDKAFKNAVTVTQTADCVDIKTYHASKGLEYPFVFLCQLSEKFIKPSYMYLHNRYGCGFAFSDKSRLREKYNLLYNDLSVIKANEDKSERMRLFYVGCTRAKEKLFIVYAFETKTNSNFTNRKLKAKALAERAGMYPKLPAKLVQSGNNMLEWVTMALARIKGTDKFLQWLDAPKIDHFEADSENVPVEFSEYTYKKMEEAEKEGGRAEHSNIELADELFKRFERAEKNDREHLPSKLTVTEIVRMEIEKEYGDKNPEFYPNLPRLDEELDKLSAAEKGTFTHKFMELADYSNAVISVKDELKRLVDGGFFTEKEASGVYVQSLTKFFNGDFYRRMKNSSDIRREQKFLASMGDLKLPESIGCITEADGMIQGIADCIFKEDDGWVLVDYKTDNFRDISEMDKYGTQLAIYKAAFELILGERIKSSYIYSFKLGEGKEFLCG